MLPLRDDIPAKKFPIVNTWLIVVNVLCFAYEYQLGSGLEGFIMQHGFIPVRFFQQQQAAFLDPSRFLPVFASMFLHGSVLHLLGNMWFLYIFGDNVEDCMGHGRYIVFYLLCGLAAVALQAVFSPQSRVPMIGASGAISGVLGGYLLTFPRARILTLLPIFILFYLVEIPAYIFLALWFVLQFLQGTLHVLTVGSLVKGGVAWWAHVGGFGTGALLIVFFRNRNRGFYNSRLQYR
jgi:membrane associated rhomboid family serine protease